MSRESSASQNAANAAGVAAIAIDRSAPCVGQVTRQPVSTRVNLRQPAIFRVSQVTKLMVGLARLTIEWRVGLVVENPRMTRDLCASKEALA